MMGIVGHRPTASGWTEMMPLRRSAGMSEALGEAGQGQNVL